MKTLIASLIATAVGASFAMAPAAAQSTDAYRQAMDKAAAQHEAAEDKCEKLTGNEQDVCEAQADLVRARAHVSAAESHNKNELRQARRNLVDAEYEVAEEKCESLQGDAQDKCENSARDTRRAALAKLDGDRKADTAVGASAAGSQAAAGDREMSKEAALAKCEKLTGDRKTACVMDENGRMTAGATGAAAATVGERTREAVAKVKEKTSNMVERTKDSAAGAENATERTGERVAKAGSDAALTGKVKASLVADKDLSAMDINVDTEKGVVMLNGFVPSKAEAAKAEKVAKGVEGVTSVKNNLKVK
ncbi:hypothetical protein B0920_18385 [Massilia sp. KIM]|uniref:BON domain-containing protein n=1 Tax=Massilia sp. KIM TaxID=1955422 RepID=UPI0009D2AE22|nr:BON domain-containing protein [Massilia sp. KIM]OON60909.1 hypothetical protein B0920_18385 [Massilia sp. KIM]